MANSWIPISLAVLNAFFFSYQIFTTPRDRYETVAPAALNIIGRCKWLAASMGSLWSRIVASSFFNRSRSYFAACSRTLPFRCITYVLKIGAGVVLLSFNLVTDILGPLAIKFANLQLTVWLPKSLTEDTIRSGLWRLASLMHYYYLPFLSSGPRSCVITMSRHIKLVADNAKKHDWKKEILQQYGNLNTSATPCKQHSPVDGAKVYLYTKSLDGVNSSNLSTRGENAEDDQRGMRAPNLSVEEPQQSGSENTQYWFVEGFQKLMEEPQYRHWIINIPTRDLAAHLHRRENSASFVIDIGRSREILDDAAAMGVNLGGSQQQLLGHTYVSNDYINQLIEIESRSIIHLTPFTVFGTQAYSDQDERRETSGQTDYSLTDNNCQTLWIQGLLDLIICNCDDRTRGTIFGAWPLTIAQRKEIMDWETAPAKLVMSLFLALAKRGNLSLLPGRSLRQPWYVTWSFFIIQELEAASFVSEAIRSTNSLHPDPQGFPAFWIFQGFHVICGALSRGSTSWGSLFEFFDIAIGVGALLWARHVRKRLQDQSPTQPGMCWSGLFFQLHENSSRERKVSQQLKDDVSRFLSWE